MNIDFSTADWRKSSRSGGGNGGSCVEVACLGAVVGVRDSKDRRGPVLAFTEEEWKNFAAQVKNGEFDR